MNHRVLHTKTWMNPTIDPCSELCLVRGDIQGNWGVNQVSTGMTGSPLGGDAMGRGTVCVPLNGGNTENGRGAAGTTGGLCPASGFWRGANVQYGNPGGRGWGTATARGRHNWGSFTAGGRGCGDSPYWFQTPWVFWFHCPGGASIFGGDGWKSIWPVTCVDCLPGDRLLWLLDLRVLGARIDASSLIVSALMLSARWRKMSRFRGLGAGVAPCTLASVSGAISGDSWSTSWSTGRGRGSGCAFGVCWSAWIVEAGFLPLMK